MTKKISIIILVIISVFILINPSIVIISVEESALLFFNKIFLSMFPFFILSDVLISYDFPYYVGKFIGNIFNKLFKIRKESSIVIILSMLSGHPGNAKYTKALLDNEIITKEEATKLITFTYFPNPMFVIGSVGLLFLNNVKIGFIILLILYINNFLLGIFIKNKYNISYQKNIVEKSSNINFGKILKNSITNSFNTLIIILGNITIFTIISNIIFHYIDLGTLTNIMITSLLEITHGIKSISELSINLNIKIPLIIFTLSFSGFCIHSQIFSILSDYKLNYKFIITYRFISAVILAILSYFLFQII